MASVVIADGNCKTSWPGRRGLTHSSLAGACEVCIFLTVTPATSAAPMFSPAVLYRPWTLTIILLPHSRYSLTVLSDTAGLCSDKGSAAQPLKSGRWAEALRNLVSR